jgi:hypothetical protein
MVSIGRKRASLMRESKVLKVSTPSVQPLTISLRWKHSLPLLHPLNPSRDPPFTTSGSGSFPNSPRLTTLAGAMNTSRRPTDSCHTSRRPTDSCPRHADQLVAEPDVAAARLQRTTRRTADGSRTAQRTGERMCFGARIVELCGQTVHGLKFEAKPDFDAHLQRSRDST